MADLTFTQLQAKLPTNAIVYDSATTDVRVSLKALMGETSVALADPKVGEFISKLLDGIANAQTAFNADSANLKDLRSYPSPSTGVPTKDATTGVYSAVFTYTVSVSMPLNKDTVTALEVA